MNVWMVTLRWREREPVTSAYDLELPALCFRGGCHFLVVERERADGNNFTLRVLDLQHLTESLMEVGQSIKTISINMLASFRVCF